MAAGSPPSRAESAARPAVGLPLTAGARLPLAFIGFGLFALATAAAWLAWRPEILALPPMHPSVVALVHCWLPGFLLSVCIGAVYQLMPVVLGAPLRLPESAAWTHLALHIVGVVALVGGFAAGRFTIVALGGAAIASGVLVLATGTWRTFAVSGRRDAIGWSFALAATWLAATALFGIVLALNRRAAFLPLSVVSLLQAHAHLGLAGFFLTLLQGATFQLVPMFTLAEVRRPKLITAGLAGAQLGLVILVPALAFGATLATKMGAAFLAVGIGCSAVALGATFASRRRRALEPGLKAFATGASLIAVAALVGLTLTFAGGGAPMMAIVGYGAIILGGALSFTVLGMLCKIVPFLVWMRTYGPRAGRQPVPLANALGSARLEMTWLWLHAAALLFILIGLAAGTSGAVVLGTALLAVAVTAFLTNIVRIALHLFIPQFPAVRPAAPAFTS